jgi:hypothetical protein
MERAITLEQFYMGRDKAYGEEWTIQIARNGMDTVGRINAVLEVAAAEGVVPQSVHPFGYVASGWRPKAVNDKTSNAGKFSRTSTRSPATCTTGWTGAWRVGACATSTCSRRTGCTWRTPCGPRAGPTGRPALRRLAIACSSQAPRRRWRWRSLSSRA